MLALHALFSLVLCAALALAIITIAAGGQEIGKYLAIQVLSCYLAQGAPWIMLTFVFGLIGLGLDTEHGLAGAVLGHFVLGAILLAGSFLVRAAPLCEQALDYALDHPDLAGGVCLTLMGGVTLYLSLRWGD